MRQRKRCGVLLVRGHVPVHLAYAASLDSAQQHVCAVFCENFPPSPPAAASDSN